MKRIDEIEEYREEAEKLERLRARETALQERTRELAAKIEAEVQGIDSGERKKLIAVVLDDPGAPLPGGINLEELQSEYRGAFAERRVLEEAVREQRDRAARVRTYLSQELTRSLAGERARLLLEYAEALGSLVEAWRAIVGLRDEVESAGYQSSFMPIPFKVFKPASTLLDELAADSAMTSAGKKRIAELRELVLRGPGQEPERYVRPDAKAERLERKALANEAIAGLKAR